MIIVLISVPDLDRDEILIKSKVLRYNFRSMVIKDIYDKELLCKTQKLTSNYVDENANKVCHLPQPKSIEQTNKPSATPHDFLKGDTVLYFFSLSLFFAVINVQCELINLIAR